MKKNLGSGIVQTVDMTGGCGYIVVAHPYKEDRWDHGRLYVTVKFLVSCYCRCGIGRGESCCK